MILVDYMVAGFIPISPVSIVSRMFKWESSRWLGKNIVQSTGQKNSSKVWIGALAAAIQILLKTVLNTIQSINQKTLSREKEEITHYFKGQIQQT